MEKFKIRKNAWIDGCKVGFVVGVIATIGTILTSKQVKQNFGERYPYSAS